MMELQQAKPSASFSASVPQARRFVKDIYGNELDLSLWVDGNRAKSFGIYPSMLYHLRKRGAVRFSDVQKEKFGRLRGQPTTFLYYVPDLEKFRRLHALGAAPETLLRLESELAAFPGNGALFDAAAHCLSRTKPQYVEEFFSHLSPMVESLLSVFGSEGAPSALEAIAAKKEPETVRFGLSSQLPLLEEKQQWGAISRHVQEWCALSQNNIRIIFEEEMKRAEFSFSKNGQDFFWKSYSLEGGRQLCFGVAISFPFSVSYSLDGTLISLHHIFSNGAPRRLKIDAGLAQNLQALAENWLSVRELSLALDERFSGQMKSGERLEEEGAEEDPLGTFLHRLPMALRVSGKG